MAREISIVDIAKEIIRELPGFHDTSRLEIALASRSEQDFLSDDIRHGIKVTAYNHNGEKTEKECIDEFESVAGIFDCYSLKAIKQVAEIIGEQYRARGVEVKTNGINWL